MRSQGSKYLLIGEEGARYYAAIEYSGPPRKYQEHTPPDLLIILFSFKWGKVWLTNYNCKMMPAKYSASLYYQLDSLASKKVKEAKLTSEKK